jgi:hypothetical protein
MPTSSTQFGDSDTESNDDDYEPFDEYIATADDGEARHTHTLERLLDAIRHACLKTCLLPSEIVCPNSPLLISQQYSVRVEYMPVTLRVRQQWAVLSAPG